MRCFVPNCENTIGVPFPKDYELQNIWLKSLQISNSLPDINSFVCFDHFHKDDLEEIVNDDGIVEKRILAEAIPKFTSLEDDIEKETEEFLDFKSQKSAHKNANEEFSESLEGEPQVSQVEQNAETGTQQQFTEFQTSNNYILEQQEFNESQSSTQSYSAYSQASETDQSQDHETQDSNLVIQNNQDFLNVQHEFEQQQPVYTSEGQVYTSEGQQVQIFTTEGQTVYTEGQTVYTTSEGQHVFVAEGQPLLTQEGHQVFISEGELQNTSNENQSLILQEENYEQDEGVSVALEDVPNNIKKEKTDEETMSLNVKIEAHQQEEMETEVHGEADPGDEAMLAHTDQSHLNGLVQPEEEEDDRNMVIDPEGAATIDAQQQSEEAVESGPKTPPEKIVMQWFVPNKTSPNDEQQPISDTRLGVAVKQTPGKKTSSAAAAMHQQQGDKILITYRQEGGRGESKLVRQQIVLGRGQGGTPLGGTRLVKKDVVKIKENGSHSTNQPDDNCRLCGSKDQVNINILDNVKDNIMVLEAIQLCVHPLEVSLEDPFSKRICIRCFNLLQRYFDFRQRCLKVDSEQKRAYEKTHPMHRFLERRRGYAPTSYSTARVYLPSKIGGAATPVTVGGVTKKTHMRTIISPPTRPLAYRQTEIVTMGGANSQRGGAVARRVVLTPNMKARHSKEGIVTSIPGDRHVRQIMTKVNRGDDIQVYKLKKQTSVPAKQQQPNTIINPGQAAVAASTSTTSISTPQKTTGHKTIAVVPMSASPTKFKPSEIEAMARRPPLPQEKRLKIQEELKKVVEGTMSKDELTMDHVIVRVVSDEEEGAEPGEATPAKRRRFSSVQLASGRSEVVIPKGIRVSIPDSYESGRGMFPCFPKIGPLNTEFALIDGYLFEHRLCKGKERFLKCVSCSAIASQKQLHNGKFENRAMVKTSHNHHQLTSTEIKKHMFFYVMKKKMHVDKGLNFRSVYDEICQKDPEIKFLVPLKNLINEICKHQLNQSLPPIKSFDDFYEAIEMDSLLKCQFTYSGNQFYQERFTVKEEGTKAVIFANRETIRKVSHSKLMYVDASFKIETGEEFGYQLVTVLVWIDDSYYPIMFALVSERTMEIFKKVFAYLHDTLAPDLCPEEIVTDYEANIYYALGETYLESHIGGSVFYYTLNLYKKICELGLSRELETTSYFRNVYHMLLMLPLLPVNTIVDGLQNIEIQANDLGVGGVVSGLFDYIREQWIEKVTPDLFCVHRLENRINENVIAPFKKLRDYLMLSKGKTQKQTLNVVNVVEKLIDLESFLQNTYSSENKKSFGRDLSSSQKKNVLKAWQYIETHPKININHFFTKVIGYIKCMENQLWIWGYYKFSGKVTEDLINAANFSIVNTNEGEIEVAEPETEEVVADEESNNAVFNEETESTVVVEAVVGPSGEFVISNTENQPEVDQSIFKYVYTEK